MATKKQKREAGERKARELEQRERERQAIILREAQQKRDRQKRLDEAEARRRKDHAASKLLNAMFPREDARG